MAMFVTIGCGDREGYDLTDLAVRDAAHAHDERLRSDGTVMGVAGTPVRCAIMVRPASRPRPFLQSSLPVAGFALNKAASLDEALEIVSQTPCAVAHGVVEVWPLEQTA